MKPTSAEAARPFLKWAGGKRQLLPRLRRFYPPRFRHYWEPFLGSAAVFFDLRGLGLTAGRAVTLMDCNPDLIACYKTVRDDVETVIHELERLAANHDALGSANYYAVRDQCFNRQRRELIARGRTVAYPPSLAAMFIYLNRTGYNGLFRLNASGDFNVPAGRYLKPRICDPANLRQVSTALKDACLECAGFERVLETAEPEDFLYFDPPYAPLSRTASFTSYTAGGFGLEEQKQLRRAMVALARRGCHIMLSNSTAREIGELYADDPEVARAGIRCHEALARRSINSNPGRRGVVTEFIITNVIPAS